ncbi:MAG: MarR family transcriptional regulator [Ectothiorhodospiraceae bacterium]|nr:MarR family transcriptional regulator [Ectothiorhodospiraceae bacterium]
MAGIVRVKHRRAPYVVIDRRALEDPRLGWAARGLLGYLLAKPDDWQLRVSDLCRRGDLGRDGVHRLLKQLQGAGYLQREQVRDARGRVVGVDYTVVEVPTTAAPARPGPSFPDPAEPSPATPKPVAPASAPPASARPPLPSNQITKDPVDRVTTTTEPEACADSHRPMDRPGGRGPLVDREGAEPAAAQGPAPCRPGASPESRTLHHPTGFSGAERAEAERKLAAVDVELAQRILDELAGRLAAGRIRETPLGYLRALIDRARDGRFTPEAGLSVAAARDRRRQAEAAVARAASTVDLPAVDPEHPIAKRVARIRERIAARRSPSEQEP